MVELLRAAKESFPINILISLVIGILVGYFAGSYVSGGAGGNAIALSCSDSDGGLTYDVAGTITFTDTNNNVKTKSDVCMSDLKTIREQYCISNTEYKDSQYVCPYGCSNGACKPAPPTPTCTDSDGGQFQNVAGTVSGMNATTGSYSYSDSCSGTTSVNEQFCVGTSHNYRPISCGNSTCSNGACI